MAAGGSGPANGRSSRTYVQRRPVRVLPLARTGTVVSSAWMRSAAKTWFRIASNQRHQGCGGGAHPVRQRRDVELDAFPLVDLALTIERQVQTVLGEQNMGQQLGPCTPARDRMRGRRRLGDRFAGAADQLLAHVLDHLPLAFLGYVRPVRELRRRRHRQAVFSQRSLLACCQIFCAKRMGRLAEHRAWSVAVCFTDGVGVYLRNCRP